MTPAQISVQPRRTTQKPRAFAPPISAKEPDTRTKKPKPFTKVQKRPAAVIETDDETQPYDYQVYDDVDEDPLANVRTFGGTPVHDARSDGSIIFRCQRAL